MYTYVPGIIFVIEVFLIVLAIIYALKKRILISKKTIWYFFPLCVILFILYVIGLHYEKGIVKESIGVFEYFQICKTIVRTTIFDVKGDFVVRLIEDNIYFSLSYFITVFAIILTLYISLLSSFIATIINKIRLYFALRKECDVLIGESELNNIYFKQYKNCVILLDNKKTDKFNKYYFDKIPVIKTKFQKENLYKIFRKCFKKNITINFISFQDSNKNLEYIYEFKQFLDMEYKKEKMLNRKTFFLSTEINSHNQLTVKNKILEDIKYAAFIDCFNRYELFALDFIEKNPITKNLPNEFFDYDKATINNNTTINVVYLGFGKVSRALHRAQIMNDQLPTIDNNVIKPYNINYYAFDNANKYKEDKNTIFYSERFDKNINKYSSEEYFENCPKLDDLKYYNKDLNSFEVLDILKKSLLDGELNKIFNRIIISFGEDIDNIDYALKLKSLFTEYKYDNYEIFVRIRGNFSTAESLLMSDHIKIFGNLKSVFNHEIIVNEELMELAKLVNQKYNTKRLCDSSWFDLSAIKQFSNIYSGLNVRLKLNLLGFDYEKKEKNVDNEEVISELKEVLKCDKSNYNNYLFYKNNNYLPAHIIAYQEHLRWVALYISYGYVPMKKTDIKLESLINNKPKIYKDNDTLREHVCITTYEGLDEYHKYLASLISKKNNKTIEENISLVETYQYDHMLIEHITKLFEKSNYKLINRKTNEKLSS